MRERTNWDLLTAGIARAETAGGVVGVSAIAPDGERFSHRGDRRFVAASTVKIPLMVELYRQIDQGERALDDNYTLVAADKTPGSGVLRHLHDGTVLTLGDLLYLTIAISDNTATNVLIAWAGMARVNATMARLGMTASTLSRPMRGQAARPGDPENWATPDDYAAIMRALVTHAAASPVACDQMLALLAKQQNTRRIGRYLPQRDDLRWGSKTGSVANVTNDVGFITTARGTLILSVFCAGLADEHTGEQAIGEISRAAFTATGLLDESPARRQGSAAGSGVL